MPSCLYMGVLFLVIWSCLSPCNPMDHTPPGSSVHGDSPGKNTRVSWHVPLHGDLPNPGMEPRSPTLQVDSLPVAMHGTKNKGKYLQCTLKVVDHQLENLNSSSFWLSHVYVPSPGLNFLIYISKLLELNQMPRRSFLALSIYFSRTNTYRHFLCITHDTFTNGTSLCKGSCCWHVFNHLLYSYFGEGNGTPLQYSCLANHMDGGAW